MQFCLLLKGADLILKSGECEFHVQLDQNLTQSDYFSNLAL